MVSVALELIINLIILSSCYSQITMSSRKDLLERLAEGPVVGDGSFVITLERRGYVMAGNWTPEACLEYPDAGMIHNLDILL